MYIRDYRQPEYDVNDIFLNRWSPRAMSGEPITNEELMSLFEAARWAPSSFNGQPWFFIYATRDSEHWQTFYDLLVEFNQQWCEKAAVLLVILSRKTFERNGKPNPCHSLDTGSAWYSLCLQGSIRGLVVHGMAGFDYEKARSALNIPDDYQVEAMAAVGKPAPKETLPSALQEKEAPSIRKSISEFTQPGGF